MIGLCVVYLTMLAAGLLLTQAAPVDVRTKRQSSSKDVSLESAVTELDRQNLLTNSQFVYDFRHATTGVLKGPGGHLNVATAGNFPATIGHDIAMAVLYLGPCGLDGPLYHARGTEFDYVVKGTFRIGFFQEIGGRLVVNTVHASQAMLVPQGALHFIQNMNCTDSTLVAGFNSADPGIQIIADGFIKELPSDVVSASINVVETVVDNIKASVTDFPALGIAECRARCGLT